MCVSCICEAAHVLYTVGLKYTQKPCEGRVCARSTYVPFSPSHDRGRGGSSTWCLMGSLSQNGPSCLFLAFPLPRRLRQPISRPGDDVMAWLMCVLSEAHPSKQVLADLGPGQPPVPRAPPVFRLSTVALCWSRNCLPEVSRLMLIILFWSTEWLKSLPASDVK